MASRTKLGASVVRKTFGGVLIEQGAGFYVALELLALIRGSKEAGLPVLPELTSEPIRALRRSHDFARRLIAREVAISDDERALFRDDLAFHSISALVRGLVLPIPGKRKRPNWLGEHLVPFVGDLVHFDAAPRRASVNMERYAYRGGGGLVHKALRCDSNSERREAIRDALSDLVSDSQSGIGRLSRALKEHDRVRDEIDDLFEDSMELKTHVFPSAWWDVLRDGVLNITKRDLPTSKKVESLLHWVPFCLARFQLDRSLTVLELDDQEGRAPLDFGSKPSSLRKMSRAALGRHLGYVLGALTETARTEHPGLLEGSASRSWASGSRGFYSRSLGAIGGLNAMMGKRHYVLRHELLEAIVLACLDPGEEMEFQVFCENILCRRLQVVVDPESARQTTWLVNSDLSDFEENVHRLASQLKSLGLLHSYSDMTQMVKGEVE
jgi:hypothetical protein